MATKNKSASAVKPKAPKIVCQNRDCIKMGRHQDESDFYQSRNLSIGHHPFCKECVDNNIDVENIQTVYDVLKILDTPFIAEVWKEALQDEDGNYFRRYMELLNSSYSRRYGEGRWKDSIFIDNDGQEISSISDKDTEVAQWDDEWQGNYTKRELKYLNDYYNDLQKDFKIVTRNHRDYARKIAQASLAMNMAFNQMKDHPEDKDAVSTYKTASANFDVLSKSAQFAESQRGANDVSLGCFGRVFDAVEKHNWVPQHIPDNKDLFDKIIEQFSNIKKSL